MTPGSGAATLGALASRFIEVDKLPWIETGPSSRMKVLMHDPKTGMLTVLTKLAPGGRIPEHTHEGLEQTMVLEGWRLVDDEGACTAGNFVIRAKGSRHSPVAPNGCTMLVFFMKPTAHLARTLLKNA